MNRIPALVSKTLLLTAVLWAPSDLFAQANIEIEEEDDFYYIQFNEGEGTPIKDLITLCQTITGYAIQFQEADMTDQNIYIIGRQRVKKSKEGFFQYFQSVLVSYEFICAPYGPEDDPFFITIKKISLGGASRGTDVIKAQAPVVKLEEVEQYKDHPGRLITITMQLKYIEARNALQSLNPYFITQGANQLESIRAVENANSLIITGFANKVYYITKLVNLMDVEPQEIEAEFVKRELEYAVAEELQPILTELLTASQGVRPGSPASAQRSQGLLTEPEPKIIAEPRTNSLLVTGSEKALKKINHWIDTLDIEVDPRGDIHVYRLKNTLAGPMQEVLDEMLKGQQEADRSRRTPGAGTTGTASTTGIGAEATVVADDASNSLVITASKTKYAELLEVIQQLDIRRRQVLIESAIVELQGRIDEALGVELAGVDLKDNDPGVTGSYDRPWGFTTFGLSELVDTDGDGIPNERVPNVSTGFTGGIFNWTGDGAQFPIIINTLARKQNSNILSIPSILTNDNEEARISAQDEQPTFSINQGQNTDSTTFEDYEKAGIVLTISPSISAGNYLKLDLTIEVSSFDQASDLSPPPKSTREVKTSVTIPDGHTMVIGGVIQKDKNAVENKIPFLGDLPLIGWLFRSQSESERKVNLYVFITPHIIGDDFANLDDISYRKKKEVEALKGDVLIFDPDFEYTNAKSEVIDAEAQWIFEIPSYVEPDTGETSEEYKTDDESDSKGTESDYR